MRKDKIINNRVNKNAHIQANINGSAGITLIALVITIVVIIILATITINFAFGDDGLINMAEEARDLAANSTDYESNARANLVAYMNEYIAGLNGGSTGGGTEEPEDPNPPEPEKSEIEQARDNQTEFGTTTDLKDDSGDTVWIPGGFKVASDSATDADDGIVIEEVLEDTEVQGNQFVWIPVGDDDLAEMYNTTAGSTKLTGVDTTTSIYSNLRVRSGDSYTPDKPNTTNIREPDVLSSYDTDSQYYQSILNYGSTKAMADAMVAEYLAVYTSIEKYDGFYIGRYELTGTVDNPTVQKGQDVLAGQNWYNSKKACTNVVSTNYAQTTMIYGNQWDEVMDWLVDTGEKMDSQVNEDSSSWGNYNTASGGTGEKQKSGSRDTWKANNIYDLAGNCREWTQEANYAGGRVYRGGDYVGSGSGYPASDRNSSPPNGSYSGNSSRPALYVK